MRTFALTPYPLSHAFRDRLESSEGELEYLSVPQLRRLGTRGFLQTLRRVRGRRCLIALEDPSSVSLLPVLQAVAAALLPARIELVFADLTRTPLTKLEAVRAAAAVAPATVGGHRARRAAAARLERLLAAPREEASPAPHGRVLSLNANLWFGVKAGGSLAHTAGVANGFASAGYDVDLLAPFRIAHPHPQVREHPVAPPGAFAIPTELNYFRHEEDVVAAAGRIAQTQPPAFVYHRLSIYSFGGARLSRSLAVPLVVEYNGSEVWVARHWGHALRYEPIAVAAEEALLRHAHVVVTVSDVLRDELVERGVDAHRIVTYPNCVDPALFDPDRFGEQERREVRERHGIAADAVVATFVGTFGRWHGTDVLARAIKHLEEASPDWLAENRLHFLLVGDGLRMPEVERILGGRRGRFHTLTGIVPQPETPAYLAASDLVLSPHVRNEDGSRFFGSPTKLFEYMAMRLPIVASDLDQLGEVLRPAVPVAQLNEVTSAADAVALLATPGSVEELAEGIRHLGAHPEWRRILGENARRLALARYTWDAHVAAVLARLHDISG